MKLIIEDDEGRKTVVPLVQEEMEITIGRQEDNAIRLTERNVSRKHARLTRRKSDVFIEDLGSYCGVKVNGQRIQGTTRIALGDVFQIGDYDLGLQGDKKEESARSAGSKEALTSPGPSLSQVPSQRLSTSIISIENAADYDDVPVVDIPLEEAPRIVILSGDFKGREYACIRSVLTVGRDFENDIAIDHRSLSRNHCKFIRTPGGEWKVVDLASSNGVQVNGERYSVGTLTSGDTVSVGRVKLRFLSPGEEPSAAGARAGFSGGARGKSGPPVAMIGLFVGLLALAGAAGFFILKGRSAAEGEVLSSAPPPAVTEQQAASQASPPPPPTETAVDAEALQAFEEGKALMAAGKFSEALAPLQKAAEAKIEGADALVGEVAREVDAADALKAGQALLEEARFDEARAHLAEIPSTSALSGEVKALQEKIEAAEAEAEAEAREREAAEARQAQLAAKAKERSKQATAKKARHPYGSAYVEIPAEKMQELDGYLGEMCDNPGKAIGMLRRLIRENPNYGDAYMFLGSCYIATQETDKGERQYRFFLNKWPKHPDAQMVRDSLGQ